MDRKAEAGLVFALLISNQTLFRRAERQKTRVGFPQLQSRDTEMQTAMPMPYYLENKKTTSYCFSLSHASWWRAGRGGGEKNLCLVNRKSPREQSCCKSLKAAGLPNKGRRHISDLLQVGLISKGRDRAAASARAPRLWK